MVAYSTGSVEYSTVSRMKYKIGFIRRIIVAFNSYLVIFLTSNLNSTRLFFSKEPTKFDIVDRLCSNILARDLNLFSLRIGG